MEGDARSHAEHHPPWPKVWSRPIHRVFEDVVDRFPDRTAVVCGHERLTYCELNDRSNAIAASLLRAGLSSESTVAVAVPKSAVQITSLLGVLKAGGAYVPIVTNQPDERLRRILRDAGCRYAVASPGYADDVLSAVACRIDPDNPSGGTHNNPSVDIGPDHLAYVMYTSGSTGEPKGAMIEHAGVVRLVHAQDYMPFGPELNFLYGGPLSFDLSTIEIYTPLLHGAKLLISQDLVLSPETVRRFAEREDLRAVCISFSLFRALFEADAGAFERIPVVGVCGEPADAAFIREAQDRLPHARFYNAYGPTECTALSTTYQIARPCPSDPPVVPIGVPLHGMSLRIVDQSGRPVAPGDKGELVIGGWGVGRGYINDPSLTAAKFTSDGPDLSQRWYRSGDLARMLPDGVIAYEGRIDDQIKIRGQRIELGEIDAALSSDPFVKAAASVVVGTGDAARVGACVVPRDLLAFNATALVERLGLRLTQAMLPSVLVPVETIPINANGKIDRTKVRAMIEEYGSGRATARNAALQANRGSMTENEHILVRTIQPILHTTQIDLDASWTRNGGDSLRAMVLRIRLRDQAGLDVGVPEILAASTLRDLAARLRLPERDRSDEFPSFTPGPVPVSPAQRRLWTIQQIQPNSGSYNVAYRFGFRSRPDRAALEAAWRDLHRRHPVLRVRFESGASGEPEATLLDPVACGVTWDVGMDDPIAVRDRIRQAFDLAEPPFTRLLVDSSNVKPTAILVMHHIVTDAWSMDIMLRDLEAFYRHHRDGAAIDLPPPGPGAVAHAAWLTERIRHVDVLHQATQAADQFRSVAPTYALMQSDGDEFMQADTTVVPIPHEMRLKIERYAGSTGVSPHAVLLASFAQWAAELCGTSEPSIGLAFSNRDDGPFTDAVGFCVETVPVRIDCATASFRDAVGHAAVAVAEGHARRSIPFDLIARLAGNPGAPGRTPITDVFFNVIDPAPIQHGSTADAEFVPDPIELDHGFARFDLLATVYRFQDGWRLCVTARRGRWARREGSPGAAELLERITRSLSAETSVRAIILPGPRSVDEAPVVNSKRADDPGVVDITSAVLSVFRNVLGNPTLGPDDDFFRCGGDSLKALRAFGMIRQAYPTSLTTVAMFRHSTASALAERMFADDPGNSEQRFVWLSEPGRTHAAFVFPGVTGDALSMRSMLAALGEDWSTRAAMYPGTNSDRPPSDSLAELIDFFLPTINDAERRHVLIGYSFGGILAYELAVRLQSQGRTPEKLVLIDTALMRKFPVREGTLPLSVHIEKFLRHDWSGRARQIARVPAGLFRRVRDVVWPEDRYDRQPAIRVLSAAHLRAIRDYVPSARYQGPVLIIRAVGRDADASDAGDPTHGWGPYLSMSHEVVDLPTDHVGLMKSSAATEVARAIVRSVESSASATRVVPRG
jgi:tyrocidine synthetase-3